MPPPCACLMHLLCLLLSNAWHIKHSMLQHPWPFAYAGNLFNQQQTPQALLRGCGQQRCYHLPAAGAQAHLLHPALAGSAQVVLKLAMQ